MNWQIGDVVSLAQDAWLDSDDETDIFARGKLAVITDIIGDGDLYFCRILCVSNAAAFAKEDELELVM